MSFTFNGDAGPTVYGGRDGELKLTASIDQTTIQTPNPARLLVTNPSPALIDKVKEFSRVTVCADYEDRGIAQLPVIYTGDVKQARFFKESDYVTTGLEIFCADGGNTYQQARVSKTLAAGHTPKDRMQAAADAMAPFGISMGLITADLSKPQYSRGVPLIGMARSLLREVSHGAYATWSIQNSKLCIVDHKKPLPGRPIVLNSQTGLIGMPEQSVNGILVRCLHRPSLCVHCLVQIDQKSIIRAVGDSNAITGGSQGSGNFDLRNTGAIAADGIYQVISVKRSLDTRGNDWFCDLVCIAQVGGSPNAGELQQGLGKFSGPAILNPQ